MSFSFLFCVMKWKEYFCRNPKLCLGKVLVQLSYRLNHPLFLWTTIFLWMKYDRRIMVIPTRLLINISKKQLTLFVANDNIWASKQKLKFGKLFLWPWAGQLPTTKDFFDEINECDFLILKNKMCQNLRDLHTHWTSIS